MYNKKGAIELSVTAIVILILAIVMLGLGLGFIRGMFGKVTTSMEEQIAAEPEPPAPSASEPISLSRESIIAHAKDSGALKVAIYNPTNSDFNMQPNISCTGLSVSGSSYSRTIKQGESQTFSVLFEISSTAPEKTYLCRVYNGTTPTSPTPGYEKDLTIRIIR